MLGTCVVGVPNVTEQLKAKGIGPEQDSNPCGALCQLQASQLILYWGCSLQGT